MSTNHEDLEVLCALSANGNLTGTESAELREHVENCVACHTRLVEMRQVAIHLLLAQASKAPSKRSRKGMRERFAARAISEGIPLTRRSQGVGFSALGLVTVLLVVLLLVTASLGDGPYRRSVVKADLTGASHVSALLRNEISPERIPNDPFSGRVRTSRVLNHHLRKGSHGPLLAIFRVTRPGLPATERAAWQSRQFTFTPYSRNSGMRAYPLSTTIRLPEVVPSFTSPYRVPRLTLDATSEVFKHNAPHLLAQSEQGAFDPSDFKANAFRLIRTVVPQATDQERSQ